MLDDETRDFLDSVDDRPTALLAPLLRGDWHLEVAAYDADPSMTFRGERGYIGDGRPFIQVGVSVMPRHLFVRAELAFTLLLMDKFISNSQCFNDPNVGAALAEFIGFPSAYVIDRTDATDWDTPALEDILTEVDERFTPIADETMMQPLWLDHESQALIVQNSTSHAFGRYYLVSQKVALRAGFGDLWQPDSFALDDVYVVEVPAVIVREFGVYEPGPHNRRVPARPARPTTERPVSRPGAQVTTPLHSRPAPPSPSA
ncbi:hypothetical protein FK529_03065 [Tsukamurella asaccharolytica]|uniref:Uncharacterized protein n=1 Tax=Tsukamurella asaccharolytica TaxID=2592067 RepID=A0A5C5RFF5_9ACTN|nr:hypothetical protein [Tsukamurella asaccharolytica]TWS21580.1 hypothetical protein FK529_03065 [Tsukamurella asaccharolytica]